MKKILLMLLAVTLMVVSSCHRDDDCEPLAPSVSIDAKVISDYPWAGVSPQFYVKVIFQGDNVETITQVDVDSYVVQVMNSSYNGNYNIQNFYKHTSSLSSDKKTLVVDFLGPFLYKYPTLNQIDIYKIDTKLSYNWYGNKKTINN